MTTLTNAPVSAARRWGRRFGLLAVAVALMAAGALSATRVRTEIAIWQARQSLESRQLHDAAVHLERALQSSPDRAEAHFLLARTCRRLGQFDKVREHLLEAHRLGWPQETVQREEWLALAQSGQLADAAPHLAELLRDPRGDGAEICEAYVEGYFSTYRFDQGLAIVEAWEADFPQDPRPHVYRGLVYEHARNWNHAVEAFERAVARSPDDAEYRLRLAVALMKLQRYEDALVHFRTCGRARPDDPEVLCRTADCLRSLGELDEPRRLLRRTLELDPQYQPARLAMGQLEQAAGDAPAAIAWLEPLCRETPTDSEARYALAQALQAAGQADAARDHFDFVAEAREQMLEVQRLTDQDRFHPGDAEIRYQIGVRLLKYDNPAHGAAWLRSVLELNPRHQPAHRALAGYYESIGSNDLSEYHRQQADDANAHEPTSPTS